MASQSSKTSAGGLGDGTASSPEPSMSDLAAKVLAQLGFRISEDRVSTCVSELDRALAAVLEYHQAAFAEAERASDAQTVASSLAAGQFAHGSREGVNLWEDVVLARMVARHDDHAIEVFRRRFAASVAGWQRRFARGKEASVEDFIADLLLPRERSGPRIETYKGHAPLHAWLKQVFISLCHKHREAERATPQLAGGPGREAEGDDPIGRLASEEDAPDERFARNECAEKLAPIIADCMKRLDGPHRQVLLMSVVDGIQQKKIAKLHGVPEYKITRMKQSAIRRIVDTFQDIAKRSANRVAEGVRLCVELLLEKFPVT